MGGESGVLCRYFFQAMMVDEDAPPDEYSACLMLSAAPTLAELRARFPFVGTFHFRVQVPTRDGSYCWMDLTESQRELPVGRDREIRVKVLQISLESDVSEIDAALVDAPEDRQFDAFFRAQQQQLQQQRQHSHRGGERDESGQDVGAVLSGVTKALTSKMKQSGLGQTLQKQSAKIWEKVKGATGGPAMTPPTAAALAQLAKLVSAMKTPLSEGNREHIDFLARLWATCFDPQPFTPRGQPWGQLGFRYEDPLGELQCVLPLQCLVFFHEVHRQVALPMLNDQALPNHPDVYPYALVASKVTYLLAEILQLRDGACLGLERPFWRLFEDPIAFYELFSIVFHSFDQSWKARNGKSNDVGFHLDYVADFAQELLRRGPENVPMLVDYAHQMQKW
ncbi:hypothetical protein ATCC90586_000355 [Pythium insidiosum]|nr:hypothetical protein ATCC90586_000355 [Pythium insidiosum]